MLVVIIIVISKLLQKRNEIINSKLNEFISSKQEEIKKQCSKELSTLKDIENKKRIEEENLKNKKQALSEVVEQIESRRAERLKSDKELVEATVKGYYDSTILQYRHDLQDQLEILQEMAQQAYQDEQEELSNALLNLRTQLAAARSEVDDWEARRDAINKDIIREREIREKENFYKIQLNEEELDDIHYLLSIMHNIRNKELLSKLIWSEYLQRPFKQMIKNVLGTSDPKNVIYKITNIKTNEIYIGKTSGSVINRWTEHIKTSLNIGTIKRANIHLALYEHWNDFTFQVIEIVDSNSNLSEHEKYWIDFYKSTIYGYNMKSGG